MNREGRWAGIAHLPSGAPVPSEGFEPTTDGRLMTVPLPLGYEGVALRAEESNLHERVQSPSGCRLPQPSLCKSG